jgi:hypothetical protein
MRGTTLALSTAVLLVSLAACADPDPSAGGRPVSTSPGLDARPLGIYEAAIRNQIEFKNEKVWIFDRICSDAEGTGGGQGECLDAFTPAEQDELLRALADVPSVRFVEDTDALTRRIFDGRERGQIIRVGRSSNGMATSRWPRPTTAAGFAEADRSGWWSRTRTDGPLTAPHQGTGSGLRNASAAS